MFKKNNKKVSHIVLYLIFTICFLMCSISEVRADTTPWSWETDATITPSSLINGNNITCSIADAVNNSTGGASLFANDVNDFTITMYLERYSDSDTTSYLSRKKITRTYDESWWILNSARDQRDAFLTFDFTTDKDYVGNYYYVCQYEWSGNVKYYGSYQAMTGSTTGGTRQRIAVNNARLVLNAYYGGGLFVDGATTKTFYTKYNDVYANRLNVYTGIQNSTVGTILKAVKNGYTFNGWYTDSVGGVKILNADNTFAQMSNSGFISYIGYSTWGMTENKTLYAQFSDDGITYVVHLNDGLGSTQSAAFYYKYGYSTQYGSDSSRRCYYFTNSSLSTCVTTPTSGVFYLTTPPTKTNYSFKGYYSGTNGTGTKYIDYSGYWYSSLDPLYEYTNNNNSNVTLYGNWTIDKPATPTISGGATKIYNSTDTSLTCATTSTYGSGINLKYSFGYATSDGGTPSNWTTPSTSNTYVVSKDAYVGQRWYSCRVYAEDSYGFISDTVTSETTADTAMTINNASITFNVASNGGTISGTSPLYSKYGVASLYTGIRNTTAGTIPTATKTGYVFNGWWTSASGGTKVINADKTVVASVSGWTNASKQFLRTANSTLYAQFTIANPATPTISGGATKIYNSTDTSLTCATSTTYSTGISKYYSFGYATSDGGTPSNWTTPTTTNTLSVAKDAYVGQRWYSCRVYATDGTLTSDTVSSLTSADTAMTINNASITFNVASNGGTISGTSPLYSKYGVASLYTGIRNTTAGTIPTATKTGYTFDGWYTAATSGTKVINDDRSVVASVSGWTNASKQFLRTENSTLFAQFTPNIYSVTLNNQSADTSGTTEAWYEYNTTRTIDDETCYYYTDSALTTCLSAYTITPPTKDHYIFDGYYTETNGEGTKYVTAEGVFTNNIFQIIPSEIDNSYRDNIILYANWVGVPITVTLPDNTTETYNYGDSYTLGVNDEVKANETATVTFKYQDDETLDTTGTVTKTYTPNGWLVNDSEYEDNEVLILTENIVIKYNYTENVTGVVLPEPTREHYTFDGWFDESDNKVTSYTELTDITLFAHWIGDEVTVTLPDNTVETYNYGDSYTLDVNNVAKANETATVTFKYQDDKTLDTTGTVTKTYTPNGWLVNDSEYEDNEVLILIEDIEIEYNYTENLTEVVLPEPEREHYTFDGWYDDANNGNKITSYTTLEDITLYAYWISEEITVTLPDETTETHHYGDSYTLGVNNEPKANDMVTVTFKYMDGRSDTTSNVTKSYTPNGWLVNDVEKDDEDVLTLTEDIVIKYNYTENLTGVILPEPTREHYEFDGWYDNATNGNKVTTYATFEDTTLYAHWIGDGTLVTLPVNNIEKSDELIATVTFDPHNGEASTMGIVVKTYKPDGWLVNGVHYNDSDTVNSSYTAVPDYIEIIKGVDFPEDPTKTDYEFTGWFTEETGGELTTVYRGTENITLHAQYTDDYAYLQNGVAIRDKLSSSDATTFRKATLDEYNSVKDTLNSSDVISTSSSPNPVYMWLSGVEMLFYSEASTIFMNSDCSQMFSDYYMRSIVSVDISGLNSSKVTNMQGMFSRIINTSLDLSTLDTRNVTNMVSMFSYATNLTSLDLSTLDTRNVTNMASMFNNVSSITSLDLSTLDTRNVTNMSYMFANTKNITSLDLSTLDTRNVTNMEGMFSGAISITSLDLSTFDTRNVTSMDGMFNHVSSITSLDLRSFDTGKATKMAGMFQNAGNLKTIYVSDKWSTNSVSDLGSYMFDKCNKLVGEEGTTYDQYRTGVSYAHVDGGETNPGYLSSKFKVIYSDGTIEKTDSGDYTLLSNNIPKDNDNLATVTFVDGEETTTSYVQKSYTPNGWLIDGVHYNDTQVITVNSEVLVDADYVEVIIPVTIENLSKEHYTFDGWYDEEVGGTKYEGTYDAEEDITLYAHWIGDEITVTLPDNTIETYNYGDSYTLDVNNETKENDTATVTFKYQDEETSDTTGTVTKTYTPNGWLVNDVESENNEVLILTEDIVIKYNYTESVTGPEFPTPTRDNYEFDGWYDEDDNKLTSYTELTDITLFAHWIGDEVTVTLPDNRTETYHYGDSYTLGVNNEAKANETATVTFKYQDNETSDTTGTVTKTYTPNGWLVNDVIKEDNETLTLTEDIVIKYNYTENVIEVVLPEPEREHYTFDGWFDEDDNKVTSYEETVDITLYAHWIGEEITVTLPDEITETHHYGDSYTFGTNDVYKTDENGATITFKYQDNKTSDTTLNVIKSYTSNGWLVNDVEIEDNTVLTLEEDIVINYNYTETRTSPEFPSVTWEYHTFDGWYDDETGGNKVTSYNGTEDITLFAHWISGEVIVTLPNGEEEIYNYGDSYTLGVNNEAKANENDATVTFKYQDGETSDTQDHVIVSYTPNGWLVNWTEYEDNEIIILTENITIEYNYDETRTSPIFPQPTRTGYDFVGWFDLPENNENQGENPGEEIGLEVPGKEGDYGTQYTSYDGYYDITLYAHWTDKEITVTLPDNSVETHNYGDSYTLGINDVSKANENGATITFKYQDDETSDTTLNVIKSYTPNGWLVNDVTKEDSEVLTLEEDIVINYNYTETLTSPEFPTPERNNYEFMGWFDDAENGNKVTSYNGTENITLFAHWSLDKPTDFELNSYDVTIVNGNTHQITATFTPNETEDTLNYTGYNNEIISVTSDGLITALAPGETSINVSLASNSEIHKTVTVKVLNNKLTSDTLTVETRDLARIIIGEETGIELSAFLGKFDNDVEYIKVYSKEDELIDDLTETVRTGMKVKLVINNEVYDEAILVIRGDIDGDGYVDVSDVDLLASIALGKVSITDYRLYAADLDFNPEATIDNMIDVSDGDILDKYVLGKISSLNEKDGD